jgi:hypothetical protein
MLDHEQQFSLFSEPLFINFRCYYTGKKIGELTHEKIKESVDNKEWILDIAVRNGIMVLACRQTGVMLFKIK